MEIEIRSPKTELEWVNYYDLRYRILRQPWNQPIGSEKNEGDSTGIHLALFESGIIKAVARLDISGEKVSQVRFVAVEEACQGKGLGKLVMNEVEKIAISRGDTLLILHAREVALPFYTKQGYQLIEKSHLLFDKIQHFLMQKEF